VLRLACSDGLSVGLDVYRPGGERPLPLTLIGHGFKGFRRWGMFPFLAERLAASGRVVASVDYALNGTAAGSEDEFTRLDLFERQTVTRHAADLAQAMDELLGAPFAEEYGVDTTAGAALVAHSMGALAAVPLAGDDPRVCALATLNGVASPVRVSAEQRAELAAHGRYHVHNGRTGQQMPLGRDWLADLEALDLPAAAARVSAPALVIVGGADTVVDPEQGRKLAEWLPESRLEIVAGADHVFGARHPWAGWTPQLERAALLLDAFLPRLSA